MKNNKINKVLTLRANAGAMERKKCNIKNKTVDHQDRITSKSGILTNEHINEGK
jgi:hypothetical protein